ncbi:hypothetical protein DV706_07310 [Natronorubrum bangense]|uniref:Uncharacterized protein n=1 Tax=Natronorubrum bangense TaxID=61858 RepID=A0A4D6HMQ7_9EURY|nr:hypothetical protein DV706_07310 [Natronorubrum bangense]
MPRSHSSRWRLRKRRTKRAESSEAIFLVQVFGGAVSASEPDDKKVDAEIALEPLAAAEASD